MNAETTTVETSGAITTGDPKPSIAAHTPGPWQQIDDAAHYGKSYAATVWGPAGPGYGLVADCRRCGDGGELERIANARLIAAAPELLAALKSVLPILEAVKFTVGLKGNQLKRMSAARAAIAKATGAAS